MGITGNDDALEFLVEQIKNNVKFLKSKGRLSTDAAQQVNALLSNGNVSTPSASFPPAAGPRFAPPPPQPPSVLTAPVPSSSPRVRALYAYNNPGDLCFKAGDIIELVPSPGDNEDWWTGKLNGQTGLFPSNHVEKIAPSSQPFGVHSTVVQTTYAYSEKPAPAPYSYAPPYQPPGPAYPPPPGPPSSTAVVQQPEAKKSKFGGLGTVLATSAAGGVGFGAGSAIGNDLINAIF